MKLIEVLQIIKDRLVGCIYTPSTCSQEKVNTKDWCSMCLINLAISSLNQERTSFDSLLLPLYEAHKEVLRPE